MQADYVLDYDVVSTARQQRLYLLARVKGGPPSSGMQRPKLNLSVVLDRSGSMAGDKLEHVKRATQFLVQHLGTNDKFSLVTYDTTVSVEVPPGAASFKDRILEKIQAIRTGSSTNLSGGWLQGCAMVATNYGDGQINRVLLLTDGLANVGVVEPDRLATIARQKRDEGITTTTLGVGMDFNEDLLRRIAQEGGGAFYFIDNPDQAAHIFREELRDLLSVVGQNLTITLAPSPQVNMVRQYNNFPTQQQGTETVFRMGDLFADELKLLLLELSIPALAALGQVEVARLRIEYDELVGGGSARRFQEIPVVVNSVADSDYSVHRPNNEVVRMALLLRAARAREEAVHHADRGDFRQANEILNEAADAIQGSAFSDDPELGAQHDMLREEAIDMEMGDTRYDQYMRKSSMSKAEYLGTTRPMRLDETGGLHARMKSVREAVERQGATPTLVKFRQQTLTLRDSVRIGRVPDNDIVIPEAEVSEYHCRILKMNDVYFLEDLNSTNGTFANGGRVRSPFRLSAGDVVTVGSWLLTFA